MQIVAVLALDQVIPFDLATPIEVFSRVRLADGSTPYAVRVCAETDTVDAGGLHAAGAARAGGAARR
jgi:hypothetical protein